MSMGIAREVLDVFDVLEPDARWDLARLTAPPPRRRHLSPAWLVLTDVVALALALAAADRIVGRSPATNHPTFLLVVMGAGLISFRGHSLYERTRIADGDTELRLVARAMSVTAVVGIATAYFVRVDPSRLWVLSSWLLAILAVSAGRLLARVVIRAATARGRLGIGVLIVGADGNGRSMAKTLARGAWLGYRPLGFVTADADPREAIDGLPVLGRFSDVTTAVHAGRADAVLVATTAAELDVEAVCEELRACDVDVRLWNGIPAVSAARISVETIDGRGVLAIRRSRPGAASALAKRTFDLVGSLVLLVVTLPVMIAVALAVRVSSGPEVLYRQTRVGEGGRPFTILKFRSMVQGAEGLIIDLRDSNDADGLLFKMHDDPRVTRLGHHLRRLALDELPQLWNVIRGDMSLVGPRPPLPEEVAHYDEVVAGRLAIKPGLTGLWQVNGRHELSFDDYVRYDLFYVKNRSFGLDLSIVLRTIPALLSRRGAY